MESFLKNAADLKDPTFTNKRPQHRLFALNIAKFVRTVSFIEYLQWLLMTVLPQYSKVSWGVSSLISHLLVLPSPSKTYTNIAQIIIYYHTTKKFLPYLN